MNDKWKRPRSLLTSVGYRRRRLGLLRQWEHPCDVHPFFIISIDFHLMFDAQLTSFYLEHLHRVLTVFESDIFDSNIVKLVVTSDIKNAGKACRVMTH